MPCRATSSRYNRTGFRANDAYWTYIDIGLPRHLEPAQPAELNNLTPDLPETDHVVHVRDNTSCEFQLLMHSNDVVLITLRRIGI